MKPVELMIHVFPMQKQKIEMVPKVVRHFPQKKAVENETGENKGQLSSDILAGVSSLSLSLSLLFLIMECAVFSWLLFQVFGSSS